VLVSGWQQAVTLLLAIVPGFIYQGTLSRLRGPTPDDREMGVRILRALAGSGFAALAYVLMLGPALTKSVTRPVDALEHPRAVAVVMILLVFVGPISAAFIVHFIKTWRLYPDLGVKDRLTLYIPTPTAWDFASDHTRAGFVRILTKEGGWIGGYAGGGSFLSGYPEAREVFMEEAWMLDDDGVFLAPLSGTTGVWVRCDDVQLVQFLTGEEPDEGDTVETAARTDDGG
jgi:hypothetical protein